MRVGWGWSEGRRYLLVSTAIAALAIGALFSGHLLAGSRQIGTVYDPVLYRAVLRKYDAALRSYPTAVALPVENGVVLAGIDPRAIFEGDDPIDYLPAGPRIDPVAPDETGNAYGPSGVIATTTIFSQFDGNLTRTVWAGNAGCSYGRPTSCAPNGNQDFTKIGMILDGVDTFDGHDSHWNAPTTQVRGVGAITFTRIDGSNLVFTTESGRTGRYSLTDRRAYLDH